MEKRERKKSPIGRIVACVVLGLVVAGAVLLSLLFINRIKGYDVAKSYTDDILATKSDVLAFVNAKIEADDGNNVLFGENELAIFEKFSDAVKKNDELMESISASDVMRDEDVKNKYKEAVEAFGKLNDIYNKENGLKGLLADGIVSDDELESLAEFDNDYIKQLTEDLIEYRKIVASFNEKYPEGKKISSDEKKTLDEDFAVVLETGKKISEKYTVANYKKVIDIKIDEIESFYSLIEELREILAERM